MKKKFLTIFIASIICAILSSLAEVFIFNFKIITLDENNQSISEISYTTETANKDTIIKFSADNKFINKLVIEYTTDKTIDYSLSYTYTGLYGNESTIENLADKFEKSFSSSITNIGETVSDITIRYKNTDHLKINKISIDNNFYFNYFRAIAIFLTLMIIFFLIYFYKDGFRIEKLHIYFAVLCSLLGSMIIVSQPAATFYSWDDQIHFEETIKWFGGTINYSNGEYNLSDVNVLDSAGRDSINSAAEKQIQIDYFNSDINSAYTKNLSHIPSFEKISYLPMAIGYNFAKFIHLPFIICFQLGKIFNLLCYIFLMAYAIKILKAGKRLLTIIALLPSIVFLASEYSYDPAVFAGLAIFIVHLVNLFLDKTTKFNFKTCLIMILSITYACFAKAIYAPFIFLILLIPKERFQNPKQSKLVKTGFIGIMVFLLSLAILPALNGSTQSDPRGENTSASEQISLIVKHPLDYATVLNNTAVSNFSYKLIGSETLESFSYMNPQESVDPATPASVFDKDRTNFYYILLILLIFVFLTDNKDNRLTKKQRLFGIGTILFIILLIWSALYLSFTPVGSNTIEGVQGRYFLPLLFPLLFFLQPKNLQNKINPKLYNGLILSIPTIITIILIYSLILIPYSF